MGQIVAAAGLLRGEEGIHFLMIGGGRRRAEAEARAREMGLENMTWLPFQLKEKLGESLSAAHLALISQRAGLEGVAVPCKLYGILASGRGIVAAVPSGSETDRVLAEEGCGVRVEPGDAEGMAEAIRRLAADRERVASMGRAARGAYEGKYTLESALDRFEEVMRGRHCRA